MAGAILADFFLWKLSALVLDVENFTPNDLFGKSLNS